MSKCLKCGSNLPEDGDCPYCEETKVSAPPPSLLERELNLDRGPFGPQPPSSRGRRAPVRGGTEPRFVADLSGSKPSKAAPSKPGRLPPPPGFGEQRDLGPLPFDEPEEEPAPIRGERSDRAPTPFERVERLRSGSRSARSESRNEPRSEPRGEPFAPPAERSRRSGLVSSAMPPSREPLPREPMTRPPPPPPPGPPAAPSSSTSGLPPAPGLLSRPSRPAAAAKTEAPETDATEIHARPAALWRRVAAFAIDFGVVAAVLGLYLAAATAISGLKPRGSPEEGLDAAMLWAHSLERVLLPGLILAVVLALAYSATFGFLWEGCTLGRKVTGIRLVDQSGLPPAPARSVLRAALSVISAALFLGGFWLALFDRKGQTLHDKMTATFVVQPS